MSSMIEQDGAARRDGRHGWELRLAVEDFLYHEADLLDRWLLEEWLGLWTEEITYLIPSTDRVLGCPRRAVAVQARAQPRPVALLRCKTRASATPCRSATAIRPSPGRSPHWPGPLRCRARPSRPASPHSSMSRSDHMPFRPLTGRSAGVMVTVVTSPCTYLRAGSKIPGGTYDAQDTCLRRCGRIDGRGVRFRRRRRR